MVFSAEKSTTARSLVEFTANNSVPISVTDQIHAENGQLSNVGSRAQLDFMVQYQGYWFAVKAKQQGTKSTLHFHGILGHLPFTYESAFARKNIMHVAKAMAREIKGHIKNDDQQRILLVDTLTVEGSLSAKVILAETTKTLLRIKPYLELITALQPPRREAD